MSQRPRPTQQKKLSLAPQQQRRSDDNDDVPIERASSAAFASSVGSRPPLALTPTAPLSPSAAGTTPTTSPSSDPRRNVLPQPPPIGLGESPSSRRSQARDPSRPLVSPKVSEGELPQLLRGSTSSSVHLGSSASSTGSTGSASSHNLLVGGNAGASSSGTKTTVKTLAAVAEQFGVSVEELRAANPPLAAKGADDTIPNGYRVALPRRRPTTTPKTSDAGLSRRQSGVKPPSGGGDVLGHSVLSAHDLDDDDPAAGGSTTFVPPPQLQPEQLSSQRPARRRTETTPGGSSSVGPGSLPSLAATPESTTRPNSSRQPSAGTAMPPDAERATTASATFLSLAAPSADPSSVSSFARSPIAVSPPVAHAHVSLVDDDVRGSATFTPEARNGRSKPTSARRAQSSNDLSKAQPSSNLYSPNSGGPSSRRGGSQNAEGSASLPPLNDSGNAARLESSSLGRSTSDSRGKSQDRVAPSRSPSAASLAKSTSLPSATSGMSRSPSLAARSPSLASRSPSSGALTKGKAAPPSVVTLDTMSAKYGHAVEDIVAANPTLAAFAHDQPLPPGTRLAMPKKPRRNESSATATTTQPGRSKATASILSAPVDEFAQQCKKLMSSFDKDELRHRVGIEDDEAERWNELTSACDDGCSRIAAAEATALLSQQEANAREALCVAAVAEIEAARRAAEDGAMRQLLVEEQRQRRLNLESQQRVGIASLSAHRTIDWNLAHTRNEEREERAEIVEEEIDHRLLELAVAAAELALRRGEEEERLRRNSIVTVERIERGKWQFNAASVFGAALSRAEARSSLESIEYMERDAQLVRSEAAEFRRIEFDAVRSRELLKCTEAERVERKGNVELEIGQRHGLKEQYCAEYQFVVLRRRLDRDEKNARATLIVVESDDRGLLNDEKKRAHDDVQRWYAACCALFSDEISARSEMQQEQAAQKKQMGSDFREALPIGQINIPDSEGEESRLSAPAIRGTELENSVEGTTEQLVDVAWHEAASREQILIAVAMTWESAVATLSELVWQTQLRDALREGEHQGRHGIAERESAERALLRQEHVEERGVLSAPLAPKRLRGQSIANVLISLSSDDEDGAGNSDDDDTEQHRAYEDVGRKLTFFRAKRGTSLLEADQREELIAEWEQSVEAITQAIRRDVFAMLERAAMREWSATEALLAAAEATERDAISTSCRAIERMVRMRDAVQIAEDAARRDVAEFEEALDRRLLDCVRSEIYNRFAEEAAERDAYATVCGEEADEYYVAQCAAGARVTRQRDVQRRDFIDSAVEARSTVELDEHSERTALLSAALADVRLVTLHYSSVRPSVQESHVFQFRSAAATTRLRGGSLPRDDEAIAAEMSRAATTGELEAIVGRLVDSLAYRASLERRAIVDALEIEEQSNPSAAARPLTTGRRDIVEREASCRSLVAADEAISHGLIAETRARDVIALTEWGRRSLLSAAVVNLIDDILSLCVAVPPVGSLEMNQRDGGAMVASSHSVTAVQLHATVRLLEAISDAMEEGRGPRSDSPIHGRRARGGAPSGRRQVSPSMRRLAPSFSATAATDQLRRSRSPVPPSPAPIPLSRNLSVDCPWLDDDVGVAGSVGARSTQGATTTRRSSFSIDATHFSSLLRRFDDSVAWTSRVSAVESRDDDDDDYGAVPMVASSELRSSGPFLLAGADDVTRHNFVSTPSAQQRRARKASPPLTGRGITTIATAAPMPSSHGGDGSDMLMPTPPRLVRPATSSAAMWRRKLKAIF